MNDYPSVDKVGGLNKNNTIEVTKKNVDVIKTIENFKPSLDQKVSEVDNVDLSLVDIESEVSSVMDRKTFSLSDEEHVHGENYGLNEYLNGVHKNVITSFIKHYVDDVLNFSDIIEPIESSKVTYEKYSCPNRPFTTDGVNIDFGIEKNVLKIKNFTEYTLPYKDSRLYKPNLVKKIVLPMIPAPIETLDNGTISVETDDGRTALFTNMSIQKEGSVNNFIMSSFLSDFIYVFMTGGVVEIDVSFNVDQNPPFNVKVTIDEKRNVIIMSDKTTFFDDLIVIPVFVDNNIFKLKIGLSSESGTNTPFKTITAEVKYALNCIYSQYVRPNISYLTCLLYGESTVEIPKIQAVLLGDVSVVNVMNVNYVNMELSDSMVKLMKSEKFSSTSEYEYAGPMIVEGE